MDFASGDALQAIVSGLETDIPYYFRVSHAAVLTLTRPLGLQLRTR